LQCRLLTKSKNVFAKNLFIHHWNTFRFETAGTTILIDRLLRRNLHEFATHVTKLLCMSAEEGENRILVQWAIQQVCSIEQNKSNSKCLSSDCQSIESK